MALHFLLTLIALSNASNAQDLSKVVDTLETKVKAREATWKLVTKQVEAGVCIMTWQAPSQSSSTHYVAVIKSHASAARASKDLSDGLSTVSSGAIGEKIKNFGDEAYLIKGDNKNATASLSFRYSNLTVKMVAPSEAMVKRFAKYIADALGTKSK